MTQSQSQTHTDHVSPEIARKLRDLGAFADREWRVGDWVWLEGREFLYIEDSFEPIAPGDEAEPLMILRPANHLDPLWESASPGECLFLPRLADLLDELECKAYGAAELRMEPRYDSDGPMVPVCDCMVTTIGETYTEAAANCLIAVMEVRKEKPCDKK